MALDPAKLAKIEEGLIGILGRVNALETRADRARARADGPFQKLEHSLAHRKGVTDPRALAASIGRKKLGEAEMERRAEAGRKDAGRFEESKHPRAADGKFGSGGGKGGAGKGVEASGAGWKSEIPAGGDTPRQKQWEGYAKGVGKERSLSDAIGLILGEGSSKDTPEDTAYRRKLLGVLTKEEDRRHDLKKSRTEKTLREGGAKTFDYPKGDGGDTQKWMLKKATGADEGHLADRIGAIQSEARRTGSASDRAYGEKLISTMKEEHAHRKSILEKAKQEKAAAKAKKAAAA